MSASERAPEPTLAALRVTEATLRALADAEPEDARGSMLALVALDVRQRIREREAEQAQQDRARTWAAQQRARVRRNSSHG